MPTLCAFSSDRRWIYYWDSFEAPLSRPELRMHEIYLGIFAHHPKLFRWLIVIRGKLVALFGLKATTFAHFDDMPIKNRYAIGEKIARFTIYSQSETEIVTGGDDKHLDFRVSVLKLNEGGVNKVVLSTAVTPHNFFGKAYLFFILPFHRFGVKTLLSNAVEAKRL